MKKYGILLLCAILVAAGIFAVSSSGDSAGWTYLGNEYYRKLPVTTSEAIYINRLQDYSNTVV